MYIDEWNVLFRAKGGLTLTLMLELFGDVYEISFSDLVTANVDMYMSVGGMFLVFDQKCSLYTLVLFVENLINTFNNKHI